MHHNINKENVNKMSTLHSHWMILTYCQFLWYISCLRNTKFLHNWCVCHYKTLVLMLATVCVTTDRFTELSITRYSLNLANVGVKHQSIRIAICKHGRLKHNV